MSSKVWWPIFQLHTPPFISLSSPDMTLSMNKVLFSNFMAPLDQTNPFPFYTSYAIYMKKLTINPFMPTKKLLGRFLSFFPPVSAVKGIKSVLCIRLVYVCLLVSTLTAEPFKPWGISAWDTCENIDAGHKRFNDQFLPPSILSIDSWISMGRQNIKQLWSIHKYSLFSQPCSWGLWCIFNHICSEGYGTTCSFETACLWVNTTSSLVISQQSMPLLI